MGSLRSISGSALAALLLTIGPAYAASIELLTGADGNGVLAAGALDPAWTISLDGGTTFSAAKVAFPAQICCNMETVASSAAWITDPSVVANSDSTAWGIGNTIIARRTFSLTEADIRGAGFAGTWRLADNTVGIFINNNLIVGTTQATTWLADNSFSLAAGETFFVSGLNVLEIRGTSVNSQFDAFWFDGTVSNVAVVPLPAAVWFFGGALAGLGVARRRPG